MYFNRRSFLRGTAGAGMALPWLESLAGAQSATSQPATRLAIFYVPVGVNRRGFFPGEAETIVPKFGDPNRKIRPRIELPTGLRPLETLTPTQQPLERVRQKVTLVTGLDRIYKQGSDVHAQCGSCFLSSATQDSVDSSQYAYLAEKMDSIKEANGTSLLDNTIFTYGAGLGDGATHQYNDLPIIVAGSGGGRLITGQHLHCAKGTPLANLWLTHAQAMGHPAERFADSTAPISSLVGSG